MASWLLDFFEFLILSDEKFRDHANERMQRAINRGAPRMPSNQLIPISPSSDPMPTEDIADYLELISNEGIPSAVIPTQLLQKGVPLDPRSLSKADKLIIPYRSTKSISLAVWDKGLGKVDLHNSVQDPAVDTGHPLSLSLRRARINDPFERIQAPVWNSFMPELPGLSVVVAARLATRGRSLPPDDRYCLEPFRGLIRKELASGCLESTFWEIASDLGEKKTTVGLAEVCPLRTELFTLALGDTHSSELDHEGNVDFCYRSVYDLDAPPASADGYFLPFASSDIFDPNTAGEKPVEVLIDHGGGSNAGNSGGACDTRAGDSSTPADTQDGSVDGNANRGQRASTQELREEAIELSAQITHNPADDTTVVEMLAQQESEEIRNETTYLVQWVAGDGITPAVDGARNGTESTHFPEDAVQQDSGDTAAAVHSNTNPNNATRPSPPIVSTRGTETSVQDDQSLFIPENGAHGEVPVRQVPHRSCKDSVVKYPATVAIRPGPGKRRRDDLMAPTKKTRINTEMKFGDLSFMANILKQAIYEARHAGDAPAYNNEEVLLRLSGATAFDNFHMGPAGAKALLRSRYARYLLAKKYVPPSGGGRRRDAARLRHATNMLRDKDWKRLRAVSKKATVWKKLCEHFEPELGENSFAAICAVAWDHGE